MIVLRVGWQHVIEHVGYLFFNFSELNNKNLYHQKIEWLETSRYSKTLHCFNMCWVYVDGACFDNGMAWARAGYGVWFGPNHPLNCSGTFPGRQTNQLAEIHAAIVAIEIAIDEQMDSLEIYTDSMYLINGATTWIDKWKNKGKRRGRKNKYCTAIDAEDDEEADG